jgi:hypothetical protein
LPDSPWQSAHESEKLLAAAFRSTSAARAAVEINAGAKIIATAAAKGIQLQPFDRIFAVELSNMTILLLLFPGVFRFIIKHRDEKAK